MRGRGTPHASARSSRLDGAFLGPGPSGPNSEVAVSDAIVASIVVESLIALLLAVLVLARYRRERQPWHLYWGVGVALVFVTLLEESALDAGAWSQLLIRSYLVLIAVLVGILSLGSAEVSLTGRWRAVWFGYVALSCAACAIVGAVTPVSSSIMYQGVVWGSPPTSVVVLSSVVTFPSALLLIGSALYGAVRERRPQLLFIVAGAALFSLAGTLYIASFPVAMVYSEFAGVVLLFLGFVRVLGRTVRVREPVAA